MVCLPVSKFKLQIAGFHQHVLKDTAKIMNAEAVVNVILTIRNVVAMVEIWHVNHIRTQIASVR